MFSLIITIVSIALVVALVAATMYHGGDTLTQGRTSADASAFVTGAQQISAAALMADTMGDAQTSVAALVTESYLSSQPSIKGGAWSLTAPDGTLGRTVRTAGVASPEVCQQINKNAGLLAAATAASGDADDALVVALADLAGVSYGCVTGAAEADRAFVFKY